MPLPEPCLAVSRPFPTALLRLAAGTLLLCVAACVSRVPAPVEERVPRAAPPVAELAPMPKAAAGPDWRPQTYTVKRGDTLYAIALDHGLDYRELAAWNNIENVNLIRPGQMLRLAAPGEPAVAGTAGVETTPLKTAPPVVGGMMNTVSTSTPVVTGAINTVLGSAPGMQVYAGAREDPFFLDLEQFLRILPDRKPSTGALSLIPDSPTAGSFRDATTAVDALKGSNVLSIVIELPTSQLTAGGTTKLGLWGTISR